MIPIIPIDEIDSRLGNNDTEMDSRLAHNSMNSSEFMTTTLPENDGQFSPVNFFLSLLFVFLLSSLGRIEWSPK